MKPKIFKDGNTILECDDSQAVKTQAEIQAILDRAAEIYYNAMMDVAVKKAMETA